MTPHPPEKLGDYGTSDADPDMAARPRDGTTKIVVWPPVEARDEALQAACGDVLIVPVETHEAAVAEIADAHAVIGRITPSMLAAARRLRWVQCPTASLEHYVFPDLLRHKCVLTNARGLFGDVVAEHVLGLLLCFTRNLHIYRDRQQDGDASKVGGGEEPPDFAAGPAVAGGPDRAHRRLAELCVTVVGYGDIGRAVADRLLSLGVTVSAVDPAARDDRIAIRPPARLDDELGQTDVVVIAAPHTPATEGLFDARRLAAMRRGAILINVGRGAIVRTEGLIDALDSGHLGGAGLDVLDEEPLPRDSRLWTMPNVILTPHVAACCTAVPERHLELMIDNVRRFAGGRPLRNVVDAREWL